jgi:hypothetical protein
VKHILESLPPKRTICVLGGSDFVGTERRPPYSLLGDRAGVMQTMNHANRFSLADCEGVLADVVHVIDEVWRATARTVDAGLTTKYWFIGCRLVEQEQLGSAHVAHGDISQTASAKLAVASAGASHASRYPRRTTSDLWRSEIRKRALPSDWLSPRRRNEIS